MNGKKILPLCIVGAGCLWGLMGLFIRRFDEFGIDSMTIVFIRALFTAVITMAGLAIFKRELLKIRLKDIPIFAGAGLLSIVFFNLCYFSAIKEMSLSVAAILLYTSPVFVMLLSAVFFKERVTAQKIIAMTVSIFGLCLVTGLFEGQASVSLSGILFGIGSAFGYALYSIFTRAAINRGYNPLTITGWSFTFAAFFSAFTANYKACGEMLATDIGMLGFSAVFAVVVTVLPYALYSLGLTGTENGKAAILASAEPVAATIYGALFFGEIPSVMGVIGIVTVIAGILICGSNGKSEKGKENESKNENYG